MNKKNGRGRGRLSASAATTTILSFMTIMTITAGSALGQDFLLVDCAGVSIGSLSTNPPDVVRTGTAMTSVAEGYRFSFNPVVSGTGLLGGAIGSNRLLGDVLNSFVSGQHRILFGAVRNPGGVLPVTLDREEVGGTFSGITVS